MTRKTKNSLMGSVCVAIFAFAGVPAEAQQSERGSNAQRAQRQSMEHRQPHADRVERHRTERHMERRAETRRDHRADHRDNQRVERRNDRHDERVVRGFEHRRDHVRDERGEVRRDHRRDHRIDDHRETRREDVRRHHRDDHRRYDHRRHGPTRVIVRPSPHYHYRPHWWGTSLFYFDNRYDRYGYDYSSYYRPGYGFYGSQGGSGWSRLDPWLREDAAARHWVMWQFDRNRDGRLSKSEARRANDAFGRLADRNRDGRLSNREIRYGLDELRDEYRYSYQYG